MDFDLFLEGVDANSISKRTSINTIEHNVGLSYREKRNIRLGKAQAPKIKDTYNKINKAILSAWPIKGGAYILIPPTVFKDNNFYILHRDEANKAMWKLYEEALKNPNEREDRWDFDSMVDTLLSSPKVAAGSVDVEPEQMGVFGKAYSIGTAAIARAHQGNGIMLDAYRTIVLAGVPITSTSQSEGAVKTWIRLAQTPGITVVASDWHGKTKIPLEIEGESFYYRSKLHIGDNDHDVRRIVAYKGK